MESMESLERDLVRHTLRLKMQRPDDRPNIYGVDAFRDGDDLIVVLHELPANRRGVSITNAIEELATDVVLGLIETGLVTDAESVKWIEHWPARSTLGFGPVADCDEETWDWVSFTWLEAEQRFVLGRHAPCLPSRTEKPEILADPRNRVRLFG